LGWVLGNLHFPIEILEGQIRVCDDSAVRQMLLREGFTHQLADAVFQPLSGAHSHGA
jgi:urease accessory protein